VGIAFKQSSFAELACSPTKLGEMMAMGIPMVVNRGVGDVDAVIKDTGAGIILDRFDRQSMIEAVDRLGNSSATGKQIRAGAERWFALEQGVEAYDSIYRSFCG
jgi:glycosyltransferase involved in cell wall biosynthesis